MTIEQLVKDAADQLIDAGYVHGEREADIFLADLLDKDTAWLLSNYEKPLEDATVERMQERVAERLKGQPLAYIIGHQQFLGWNFLSDNRALIPRPETEQLTELVMREIRRRNLKNGRFLEIGTGAGPIAISLKKHFPEAHVTATDISDEALSLAEENAKRLAVEIDFIESDLFENVPKEKFDVIVANLPYVPSPKLNFVSDQILDFEPMIAIDAGDDGLKYITPLLEQIKPFLANDSIVALEFWHTHGDDVKDLVEKYLPDHTVTVEKDLAGFDRFAIIKSES